MCARGPLRQPKTQQSTKGSLKLAVPRRSKIPPRRSYDRQRDEHMVRPSGRPQRGPVRLSEGFCEGSSNGRHTRGLSLGKCANRHKLKPICFNNRLSFQGGQYQGATAKLKDLSSGRKAPRTVRAGESSQASLFRAGSSNKPQPCTYSLSLYRNNRNRGQQQHQTGRQALSIVTHHNAGCEWMKVDAAV